MSKIAMNFESAKELVESMLKGGAYFNGEWYSENCQEAYLDWVEEGGYMNVVSKYVADKVGRYFLEKGYNVYYQCFGHHPKHYFGEPACIRITMSPHRAGSLTKDLDC